MLHGVGVDIVDVARFAAQLERTPALRERLFVEAERTLSVESLAARFAAKEALVKALGGSGDLRWHDMAVHRNHAKPEFSRTPRLVEMLALAGADWPQLSLSHDGGMAIAFVVLARAQ